jgi:hypothetical protein
MFSTNIAYEKRDVQSPSTDVGQGWFDQWFWPIYNENGEVYDTFGHRNPIAGLTQGGTYKYQLTTLRGNVSGTYDFKKFVKGLTLTGNAAYKMVEQNSQTTNYKVDYHDWVGFVTNTLHAPGSMVQENKRWENITLSALLNYQNTFAKYHNVAAMVGMTAYFYHSTCLRKLESIREQVGQYLAQLIPIEIHKESTGLVLKLQGDAFLLRKGAKLHGGILDKLIQIATRQTESFSIHLHLAEVEQLVDELQQVARILAHLIQLGASLRISGTVQHTADRSDNQGKQGAELVADIGEEAILHLLQFLVLLILHALAVLLNLPSYAEDHQGDECQEIQELGPPSSPKWSQHLYLQRCRLLAPHLI